MENNGMAAQFFSHKFSHSSSSKLCLTRVPFGQTYIHVTITRADCYISICLEPLDAEIVSAVDSIITHYVGGSHAEF